MKAAVVRDFTQNPKFETNFELVSTKDEVVIDVIASSLSNRARSGANGSHYSSTGKLPMVPGVDGIGTLPNGKKVYFVANGSFATQVSVEKGHWVEVPTGLADAKLAGMMNPALSSWMALKYRADFKKGQKVMILGATGNAGTLAVQIASRMGASEIIAVARNTAKLNDLTRLGATKLVDLSEDAATVKQNLADAGKDVDIILDYLWGDVAANAMWAIIPNRTNDEQLLKWVEIGSSAGQTAPIPGAAFRAVTLELIGSGQGSVSPRNILKSLAEILKSEKKVPFEFTVKEVPLSQIEATWDEQGADRVVFDVNR